MKIKLASNTIPNKHIDNLSTWLKKYPKLTKDKLTIDFEEKFSKFLGCSNSRLVNSGSSANLLIAAANLYFEKLQTLKIGVPAVSWSTTLSPFMQLGYEPILIDCDPINLGINLDHLNEVIKKEKISSLILVHVLGHDSNVEKIKDICLENKIRLFEDSCEALGSICGKKRLGNYGLASTFSFYYGHHISTIEGGSISSNNDEFISLITSLRSHGWSRDLEPKISKELKEKYQVSDFRDLYAFYYPGFNLRSTEINAFLGLQQMNVIEDYCTKREFLFNCYKKELFNFWHQKSNTEFVSAFAYGTLVENPEEVWLSLKNNGVESRPLICGSMGLQPFWKQKYGGYSSLRYSDQVHNQGIYLPINADMQTQDVLYVCEKFKKVAKPYFFQ